MVRLFILCLFCWITSFLTAQESSSSIYTVHNSSDYTNHFSLQWKYPSPLKEMLPTKSKYPIINWHKTLTELDKNKELYKTILLPQKEVLASCALTLVLFEHEKDSKLYKKKALYLQLLENRLSFDEKRYLKSCLTYFELQYKDPKEVLVLWQTYFHYTSYVNDALFTAEKLLALTKKATHLSKHLQEDLLATIYYILGDIHADKGSWSGKKKYYTLCYELRKKRGDDLCYSMQRILNHTSPGLAQRKILFEDLLLSIKKYGPRKDKELFNESLDYLLRNREYELALKLFEEGALQFNALVDLGELSYGHRCPYLYLAIEALSKGTFLDDSTKDSLAMRWFVKWLNVVDSLSVQPIHSTTKLIELEQQQYLNYVDHTCSEITKHLLYYGNYELALQFFQQHQRSTYSKKNTAPELLYNFNFFHYKFITHHSIHTNDSLVLIYLKDYLDLSYELVEGEKKANIEGLKYPQERGRECIAWLGVKTAETSVYLQYLNYWISRAKQFHYLSEEILAHRYYCAALRIDEQYIEAFKFALKLTLLTYKSKDKATKDYALRVREYFLENVLNHYPISSKERQKAIFVLKKHRHKKDRKWFRKALKQLLKQKPYIPNY